MAFDCRLPTAYCRLLLSARCQRLHRRQQRRQLRIGEQADEQRVLLFEQGTRGVDNGMALAQRAGEVIGQLSDTIREAAQAAQQIAASAHQQSMAMDQIAQAIKEINLATGQFVAGARQSQTAAEGLTVMARQLQAATDRYRIKQIEAA